MVQLRRPDDAIIAVVDDAFLAPSERDRFLLCELQALFDNDGLVTSNEVVAVVAGPAHAEYQDTSANICQPGRAFREGLTHMGFCAQQANRPVSRLVRTGCRSSTPRPSGVGPTVERTLISAQMSAFMKHWAYQIRRTRP